MICIRLQDVQATAWEAGQTAKTICRLLTLSTSGAAMQCNLTAIACLQCHRSLQCRAMRRALQLTVQLPMFSGSQAGILDLIDHLRERWSSVSSWVPSFCVATMWTPGKTWPRASASALLHLTQLLDCRSSGFTLVISEASIWFEVLAVVRSYKDQD